MELRGIPHSREGPLRCCTCTRVVQQHISKSFDQVTEPKILQLLPTCRPLRLLVSLPAVYPLLTNLVIIFSSGPKSPKHFLLSVNKPNRLDDVIQAQKKIGIILFVLSYAGVFGKQVLFAL